MSDPKQIVQEGYDHLVETYLADRGNYDTSPWLERFAALMPPGGQVLDLGCGAGVPIASTLTGRGFNVTGVDISSEQIRRARELVPTAHFEIADMATVEFPDATFDGICAFYSIIHVPRGEHQKLLGSISRWLKPSGVAVLVLGAQDWEGEDTMHDTPMYWSHFNADENLRLLHATGLEAIEDKLVPDPPGAHLFVIARRH